jgi:glutamyl-tRNA(Gln) amidotransferase subunit E
VNKGINEGQSLTAIKLDGFAGMLKEELMPAFRLGTELAGYAKTRGFGGLIHSDEDLPKYKFSEDEIKKLEKTLGAKKEDAWILLLGDKEKTVKMLKELLIPRIQLLNKEIPKEVRSAKPDGTSAFMRPMPGSARMYPETDVPPMEITHERMHSLKIPELIEDITERYQKLGLAKDLAEFMAKSEQREFFDRLIEEFKNVKPSFIAETLIPTIKDINKRLKLDTSIITKKQIRDIFQALDNEEISKESVYDMLVDCASAKGADVSKYKLISDQELKKEIQKLVKENPEKQFNALIGLAMRQLRGKADGKKISDFLKELVE